MTEVVPGNLDALIREAMEEWQVPGLAVAVVRNGEPDWLKAYGLRDVEAELPVTSETQFLLCSITKSFTALGLALLVDEGRLDWAKPVREYLPEFRLHDAVATERVTVADLLCHRSGLPRHDWVWMPADTSRAEMLTALRHIEPSKDIRAEFQYSNLGYLAAGAITERLSGLSWEEFTHQRITKPLGMIHTGFSIADLQQAADSAKPYVLDDQDEPGVFTRRPAVLWPIADTAAGGINAAASDMAKYMRLFLSEGVADGKRMVSTSSLIALQQPRIHSGKSEFPEISDYHYGFGLNSHHYRGERVVSHSGGWIGWGTLMSLMPSQGCGITVLTNRAPSPVTDIVTLAIFDHLMGKEQTAWLERFRERRRAFIAQRSNNESAKQIARRADAPSRPLNEYVGDYVHPGYGSITIEAVADGLVWKYRGLSGAMIHRHYDIFDLEEKPDTLWPGRLPITFLYDREGYIDRLCAPFEQQVADIIFRRAARGESLDPEFRKACVGIYLSGPVKHVVALDSEGQLTLSPTGQPTYRLAPYRDCVFLIQELTGYRVEFLRDAGGKATKIIFHQPDGTFQAQREGD